MASPPGVANASALYGPRVDAAGIPVALSAHAAMTKQPSLARRILRTSALLAALLFGLLACSADGLFYHPSSAVYARPDSYGLDGVEQAGVESCLTLSESHEVRCPESPEVLRGVTKRGERLRVAQGAFDIDRRRLTTSPIDVFIELI